MSTETSDRIGLHLTSGVESQLTANCRDAATADRFKAAKSRSEERIGRQLTHEEFTNLLLDIYELGEQRDLKEEP